MNNNSFKPISNRFYVQPGEEISFDSPNRESRNQSPFSRSELSAVSPRGYRESTNRSPFSQADDEEMEPSLDFHSQPSEAGYLQYREYLRQNPHIHPERRTTSQRMPEYQEYASMPHLQTTTREHHPRSPEAQYHNATPSKRPDHRSISRSNSAPPYIIPDRNVHMRNTERPESRSSTNRTKRRKSNIGVQIRQVIVDAKLETIKSLSEIPSALVTSFKENYRQYVELLQQPMIEFAYKVAGYASREVESMIKVPYNNLAISKSCDEAISRSLRNANRTIGLLQKSRIADNRNLISHRINGNRPPNDLNVTVDHIEDLMISTFDDMSNPNRASHLISSRTHGVIDKCLNDLSAKHSKRIGAKIRDDPGDMQVKHLTKTAEESIVLMGEKMKELEEMLSKYDELAADSHDQSDDEDNPQKPVITEFANQLRNKGNELKEHVRDASYALDEIKNQAADWTNRIMEECLSGVDEAQLQKELSRPGSLGPIVYNEAMYSALDGTYRRVMEVAPANQRTITLSELMFQDEFQISSLFAEFVATVFSANEYRYRSNNRQSTYYANKDRVDYKEQIDEFLVKFSYMRRGRGGLLHTIQENSRNVQDDIGIGMTVRPRDPYQQFNHLPHSIGQSRITSALRNPNVNGRYF